MRLYLSWASHFLSGVLVVPIGALLAFSIGAPLEGEFTCSGRPAAAKIFEGITYGCKQLEPSEQARGVVHWVRIDLTAPGIVPYVTNKDPTAVSQGWQYRLRRVADVVASEHLAVAINGTLFGSQPGRLLPMSGDLANAVNPVVANHTISHVASLDTYLLWFDDQLMLLDPFDLSKKTMAIWVVPLAREPHDDRAAALLELGLAPDETAAEHVQRGAQHVVHHLDVGVVDDLDLLPVRGLDVVRLDHDSRQRGRGAGQQRVAAVRFDLDHEYFAALDLLVQSFFIGHFHLL